MKAEKRLRADYNIMIQPAKKPGRARFVLDKDGKITEPKKRRKV